VVLKQTPCTRELTQNSYITAFKKQGHGGSEGSGGRRDGSLHFRLLVPIKQVDALIGKVRKRRDIERAFHPL
jgi:hypothetical protein